MGRAALRNAEARFQRRGDRAFESRRCCSDRQSCNDRTGRGAGIFDRGRLAYRRLQESMEYRLLDMRLVERLRCDCCGRPCAMGARLGHPRINSLSFRLVRHFWNAAELRPSEPLWRHGHCMDNGQARTDGAYGGGLRTRTFHPRGPRSSRLRLATAGCGRVCLPWREPRFGEIPSHWPAHQCLAGDGSWP